MKLFGSPPYAICLVRFFYSCFKCLTYGWRVPQSFVQFFVCTWGEALVPSPHKLCGSRKIDGLVFLLPAPSCSFVILGFVRASPSSPRHRICRVMHGWPDVCTAEGYWIIYLGRVSFFDFFSSFLPPWDICKRDQLIICKRDIRWNCFLVFEFVIKSQCF